jgi:hypothetical protein
MIKYQHKDADGSSDKSADLMNDDWAIINAILHDELNDDFDFQIGLRAWSYEITNNVFEDFDVPPQFLTYFKLIGSFWLYITIKFDFGLLYATNRESTRSPPWCFPQQSYTLDFSVSGYRSTTQFHHLTNLLW